MTAATRTVVNVEERPGRGWVVLDAHADNITVDQPLAHDPLTSHVTVSGKSLAFEAVVNVELWPYGSTTAALKTIAMGGGTEVQPFSTTIDPPSTDQPLYPVRKPTPAVSSR